MEVTAFGDAYTLVDVKLEPHQLLLDPKNPRIVLRTDRPVEYAPDELASQEVQDYILSVVDRSEYHVADLIAGIGRDGFLDHGNRMIVERVHGTEKYLVLEGNRRTAAVKHLLQEEGLEPHVAASLSGLPCQEIILSERNGFTRDEVVFKLLGMIHLKGALEWGAMERAFYIYQTYMAELAKFLRPMLPEREVRFIYDVPCCKSVAETFNITARKTRSEIAIYRSYEALKEAGYPAKQEHYSLLSLAIGNRALNRDYFGLDDASLRMSPEGLDRFYRVCIDPDGAIANPKEFRLFSRIYSEGTEYEFELVESGQETIETVVRRLERRQNRSEFRTRLEEIADQMAALPVSAAQGSQAERRLILRIGAMCDRVMKTLQ